VILLDARVTDQIATRRLHIVKYRGSAHGSNEYPFLIDEQGFTVLPITGIDMQYAVTRQIISTGIPSLDAMFAALGACTSMTMRLYADRKGINAERFSIRLSHRRIHAEDCADCDTKDGDIGEITRDITIEGDVPEAARARLMEIADRCPVHQTLMHEIKIRSRLVS
jgi:uncharacterized OsmC-like protein